MFRATLLAFVMLLTATSASAQEDVLAEMYGRGVHRYFAGDYIEAHRYLTMAIDNGTRDPRPYYFRGLVYDATGRFDEAESDYRSGATLEAQGNTGPLVGRSLARVQGSQRLEIERIRDETRLAAKIDQRARARARYEEREASESETLRRPPTARAVTPPAPPTPASPTPAPDVTAEDSRSNPFADDGGTAAGDATVEADDALGDPLAEEAATADAAAPDGTAPAEPADGDGDVFGLGDDAEDDIFGTGMDADSADDDADPPAADDDAPAADDEVDPFEAFDL